MCGIQSRKRNLRANSSTVWSNIVKKNNNWLVQHNTSLCNHIKFRNSTLSVDISLIILLSFINVLPLESLYSLHCNNMTFFIKCAAFKSRKWNLAKKHYYMVKHNDHFPISQYNALYLSNHLHKRYCTTSKSNHRGIFDPLKIINRHWHSHMTNWTSFITPFAQHMEGTLLFYSSSLQHFTFDFAP